MSTTNKPLQLLLVEDSPSDAALLEANILAQSATGDFSVSVTGSLQKALVQLKNNHFDAILLDLNLPDSTGLSTIQQARQTSPDAPIIVLTGLDDEKMGTEAVHAGVQDYLVKGQADGRTIIRAVRYAIQRKKFETALRESENRLKTLYETMIEGLANHEIVYVYGKAVDYVITDVNPAFEKITGLIRSLATGRKASELYGTGTPPYLELYARVASSGIPEHFETFFTPMEKHFAISVFSPGKGKFATMFTDITERKQAEKALAADLVAMSRLQQIGARFVKAGELADVLGEIVDAAIVITHADMGNIQLFESQSGCLKIVASRGFEQPFLDFWNAVAEGQGNCGTAMKNAQRSIVEDVTQSPIFVGTPALEVQLNARVRAVQSTPLFGHSGALIGMLSTHWHVPCLPEQRDLHFLDLLAQEAVDIIELARTEEALKKAHDELELRVQQRTTELREATEIAHKERQRLYDVLETLPVYVVLLSKDYHVPFANRFFRERFGESGGRRCYEYLFNLTKPCENCETFKVHKTNAPHHWEWTGPDERNYDIYDFPFMDADRSGLILEMGIDITEVKKAQAALKQANDTLETRVSERTAELAASNNELKAFSYSISHDLRAPLRAMTGFSNILLQDYSDKVDAKGREFLQRINAGADKMNELIDDMLSLAKISHQEMNLQDIDLSALVESVVNELRLAEPERKVDVAITQKLITIGDARLMHIALSNLIGNAWKYTSKTPAARIGFGAMKHNGETVYYVRDNGAGFDMNQVHRMFAPFQRLHAESQFPGTGIGLAIVNRIIQRHGGRISAEGETGRGATFYFMLPLDKGTTGGTIERKPCSAFIFDENPGDIHPPKPALSESQHDLL